MPIAPVKVLYNIYCCKCQPHDMMGEISKTQIICEAVWLTVTSVVLVITFLINGLSSNEIFGFKNATGEVSDIFETQVKL